ncbi:MAG TPA: hypothetical protein VGS27_07620 [Candidatus Sulfotelmatobacter sp.]|nr:hypothetical protein [Candidatus Sulfotelmatobacter sp.]
MNSLCKRIQEEKDPAVFDELVRQLNDLIDAKYGRIRPAHEKSGK